MEAENKKYLLIGGVVLMFVAVLIFRRSSSAGIGPTIITNGTTPDLSPTEERLGLAGINAGIFGRILDYELASEQNLTGEKIGLSQIESSRTSELGRQTTALIMAHSDNELDLAKSTIAERLGMAQISAGRDVGLAQAGAQSLAAQNENANALTQLRMLQDYQASQNRANATQAALSGLSSLLRSLTNPQAKSSGSSSGGSSGANTSNASPVKRITPRTPIPALNLALDRILGPNIDYMPDVYLPDYGDFYGGNEPQESGFNWAALSNPFAGLSDWLTPDVSSTVADFDGSQGFYTSDGYYYPDGTFVDFADFNDFTGLPD